MFQRLSSDITSHRYVSISSLTPKPAAAAIPKSDIATSIDSAILLPLWNHLKLGLSAALHEHCVENAPMGVVNSETNVEIVRMAVISVYSLTRRAQHRSLCSI